MSSLLYFLTIIIPIFKIALTNSNIKQKPLFSGLFTFLVEMRRGTSITW